MLIYNTESGQEEEFTPIGDPVRMYVCGITPKNEPHLGHARVYVATDVVRRYLEARGYAVHYVQNFTDIDDKTIAAGQREGISPFEAAQRYMDSYFHVMDRLAVRRADVYTYVTRFVPQIIAMVEGLIARGHAYEIEGDVFFSVPTFPTYGRLSHRGEDAMQAGARIEPDERKRDPRDFALWKSAKPGEPFWESPWGTGRPGWHIECSTMVHEVLGEQIDIHSGGTDLIFPHHENEIAQTESYTGKVPFVRYWLHVGMLTLASADGGQEKIAHSGTFVTIASVLDGLGIPAAALRTYLLSHHYRQVMTYSEEQLRATLVRWRRWAQTRATLARLLAWAKQHAGTVADADDAPTLHDVLPSARERFLAALDDDFNTAIALSVLDDLTHRANDYAHALGSAPPAGAVPTLRAAASLLDELTGVLGISLEDAPSEALEQPQRAAIEQLVAAREAARQQRDWAEADRLRALLAETYQVTVKDTPQGPTWAVRS